MEFTTKVFEEFRKDTQEALKQLEEKYDVRIKVGKLEYNEVDFNVSIDVEKADVNVEKGHFEQFCELYGFKPTDYLKQFIYTGEVCELIGFKPGVPKDNTVFRKVGTDIIYIGRSKLIKEAIELTADKVPSYGVCKYCGEKLTSSDNDKTCKICIETFA